MGERTRNLLHINKIPAFRVWMREKGYSLAEKKGIYEVARFSNPSVKGPLKTVILFMRDGASEHATVQKSAHGLVLDFIHHDKEGDGSVNQEPQDDQKR